MFEEVKVQLETAEVIEADRLSDVGLQTTERPVESDTELVSVTVPVNPSSPWNVTLDVAEDPSARLREEGLAEMLKSTTFTVIVIEWVAEPLIAVTISVYVVAVRELTVRVEVVDPPDASVTLAGFKDAVRPEGEAKVESETVPANPLRLERVSVEVAGCPAWVVMLTELAVMLKSTTRRTMDREWVSGPLVPVTVTV